MRTTIKRLGWLVAIWTASVLALAVVAWPIRVLLKP
jgi:Protein of unknown function (DUF2474)